MDFFKKTIYDDVWTFYLVDDDDNVIASEHAEGETDPHKKEVYFRRDGVTLETARHEIWHLFKYYCFTHSAELDAHQEQEVSAELYSYQGKRMDKFAEEVLEELIKLRDQK
jgi:hypothetical protein